MLGSWAKKLGEELNKRGLEYIWYYPKKNNVGRICKQIKDEDEVYLRTA
jgi:hypothetical protein